MRATINLFKVFLNYFFTLSATHIRRINEECENLFNEFQAEKRSTLRADSPLSTFGEFECTHRRLF